MLWRKPAKLKYTTMCIYIDEHMKDVALDPNNHAKEADTCYNYLWLLMKALAIKKRMFNNFEDYDGFSFYAASRVYFAIVKSHQNNGKIVRGKLRTPIKSCLNYTKNIFYPMKLCYQEESFNKIISQEFTTKQFDALKYKDQLMESARVSHDNLWRCKIYINDIISNIDTRLSELLKSTPFKPGTADYKNLKLSILINVNRAYKVRGKFDNVPPNMPIVAWHLPKSLSGYIRSLVEEFYSLLKKEIIECFTELEVDHDLLEKMISTPREKYNEEDRY